MGPKKTEGFKDFLVRRCPAIYTMPVKRILTYVERDFAREERKDREKAVVCEKRKKMGKWICEKKENWLMAKARYFAGRGADISIFVGFLYICTRLRASHRPYRHSLSLDG